MNEDYLWDKTGEPDPQVQELEEILGTLRYQPQPLEIPRELLAPRRWNHFPLLAIAATVLLALIATGIWLRMRTESEPQPRQAQAVPVTAPVEQKEVAPQPRIAVDPQPPTGKTEERVAVNNKRRRRSVAPSLGKQEREEALAAKEQLMLALRLASEKLSIVQRKTHSTTPANQIKNQHRVG